jgi:hypothetical protein
LVTVQVPITSIGTGNLVRFATIGGMLRSIVVEPNPELRPQL